MGEEAENFSDTRDLLARIRLLSPKEAGEERMRNIVTRNVAQAHVTPFWYSPYERLRDRSWSKTDAKLRALLSAAPLHLSRGGGEKERKGGRSPGRLVPLDFHRRLAKRPWPPLPLVTAAPHGTLLILLHGASQPRNDDDSGRARLHRTIPTVAHASAPLVGQMAPEVPGLAGELPPRENSYGLGLRSVDNSTNREWARGSGKLLRKTATVLRRTEPSAARRRVISWTRIDRERERERGNRVI